MKNKGFGNNTFKIIERSKLNLCKYCDSGNIKKFGFRLTKKGKSQLFKCLECNRKFTSNFGFAHRQYSNSTITGSIQMYFTGMSVRYIAGHYDLMGIKVAHMTIYRWVSEYSASISKYLNEIIPRTANRAIIKADKVWLKISGKRKYLFASIDDDTRYWIAYDMANTKLQYNADTLLTNTKLAIGKSPRHFITDVLPAYSKSSKRIFGKHTDHHRHISIGT